jgi:hypothetical protein
MSAAAEVVLNTMRGTQMDLWQILGLESVARYSSVWFLVLWPVISLVSQNP